MYEIGTLLLDGTLGSWEARLYVGALAAAGWLLQFAFNRLFQLLETNRKGRERDHLRLGQINEQVVNDLRGGKPFPDHVPPEK